MKILHTADWHIGQFKGPVVDGVNLRSQDTVKCLEYMVQVAIEEKPDIVCVSGDIFHQEQVGPVRYSDEMITATNIITSLAHFSKYVIVMRGTPNHDGAAQFRVLERMLLNIRNVDVVTEPGVIKTPWADIACLPGFDKQEFRAKFPGLSADEENLAWTKYISDMVFALRAECEKTPILMAHYTVPGCNMESGQTSFFTNFEPVIPREALMAARYEAVLLGHIHRPQIIEGLDNVFYSGAINAMNFNDEGQDRGFWIHEFNEKGTLVKGHKYTTPYRQFHTITWDPDEAGDYIREGAMYLHRTGISEDVTDKIVRVRYSCTSEQKKALNIPLLQKNLYELGAFYVADIEAESTIDITNRGLLSEESDPRLNLKKWLEEKTFKNPDKIVELAEPIIAEAMKQSTTAEIHGVFKPVSISVRNYRNYKEESFDFSDISFCTINGVNGAGKSSLFMDAIVDCLFEETREGDCKAWIRGTEDARSGSIEFIFDIGEKRFRVVRTRTKSGKPTLNLSQYQEESADWMNLSKERIVDTQAEIEKLLGMDSMTFRSCALIMQAQAEEDAQGAVGDVPVEGSANVTFSGTTTDTSGVAEQVTTDLESALTDVPANGHASITLDQSNNAAEIYSLATADVVSAFSETIPADGHVDVTLDQTNNAAAIYSECAGQVQSTFSQGFTASADVAVTLNWHITNPSASISTSSSGSSVSATIAGHASGGEVGLNGAELSWVGEEGLEYIIPTVPARRQRGIELWKSAGRTLGVLGPDDEISAHASGGIVGKEVSNTIPYFDTDSSSQDSEKTEKETVPTNVVSDKSGVVVQVNLSPQFNISDTNDSDVIRLIKAHIKELADDLGSEIATMLSEAYENTPVTT